MRRTGDKGAKADHPDMLKKKLSQVSPTLATDLEPTQIGIHLLIPESRTPLLITFWKDLDEGNGREVAGSREYESYIQMRCKCWFGGGEDGGRLLERLLNQEMMVMHLARPGHRTLNTHVWSNQGPNSRPLTGRRGSQHIRAGFRPQEKIILFGYPPCYRHSSPFPLSLPKTLKEFILTSEPEMRSPSSPNPHAGTVLLLNGL